MTDERIQTTVNKIAAGGFFIWYVLMLISLDYRLLILKQDPRDFWDFIAIFVIGGLFVFIACASKGVSDYGFKRFWLKVAIFVFIGMFAWKFIAGEIHSVVDVGMFLIASLLGMGPVIGIVYFLNRRWKRRAGIEEEK